MIDWSWSGSDGGSNGGEREVYAAKIMSLSAASAMSALLLVSIASSLGESSAASVTEAASASMSALASLPVLVALSVERVNVVLHQSRCQCQC